MNNLFTYCLVILSMAFVYRPSQAQNNFWTDLPEQNMKTTSSSRERSKTRQIIPKKYRTLKMDLLNFKSFTQSLSAQRSLLPVQPQVITLPMADGTWQRFSIAATQLLHPELAAKFPEIKTFEIYGIDDPTAVGQLDYTLAGFHGMLMTEKGTTYIDPYQQFDTENYIAYAKEDFDYSIKNSVCKFISSGTRNTHIKQVSRSRPAGGDLRTYRLAVATTGEYTTFHGGTVAGALSAITTTINRVRGIYKKEVGIDFQLIANNDLLIYTNRNTDPYSNNNAETMLSENQTNIDNIIGTANYDIGHVFSTGRGGIAGPGVVCRTGQKAQGVTGLDQPVGDPFDVDYVAHEIGHQFGAEHTFNAITSNCSGTRVSESAYEPGSGVTIMSYAGICGDLNNLANNSIEVFHTRSFDEIFEYSRTGSGNNCVTPTLTGNNPPENITVPQEGSLHIPLITPFRLTGSATDPDRDALTYSWEQFDLGPAGSINNPSGTAPLFRSFLPTSIPTRVFPRIESLATNTPSKGELLPTAPRRLTFRLTVRDNKGGVDYKQTFINVANTGPFAVTQPNTANISWSRESTQTITWDVAQTNQAPINCQNVNIKLSVDGGFTYPIVLLSNTPNDGSAQVTVPNTASTTARVLIEANDNIFFNISGQNFSISSTAKPDDPIITSLFPANGAVQVPETTDLRITFNQNITKVGGNIFIKNFKDDMVVEVIDVNSNKVTINGMTATINPASFLKSEERYYIVFPATAFVNSNGVYVPAITNKNDWNFTCLDNRPPTISKYIPEPGQKDVITGTDLKIYFKEGILKSGQTGNISIHQSQDNKIVQSIPVTDNNLVTIKQDTILVITPISPLDFNKSYYVLIAPNAFKDLSGNFFEGILEPTWNFTTGAFVAALDSSSVRYNIFPNPSAGKFEITSSNSLYPIKWLSVFNALGQKVLHTKIDSPEYILDLTAYPQGMYLLEFEAYGQRRVHRLIKTN